MPTKGKKNMPSVEAIESRAAPAVTYLQLYYSLRADDPANRKARISRHGHIDPINGEIPPHRPPPIRKLIRGASEDPYAAVSTRWTLVDQISDASLPCSYEIAIRRVAKKS